MYTVHRTPCCRATWQQKHGKGNKEEKIPNNVIKYRASAKLVETTNNYASELHTNAFNTTIDSHVFDNEVGIITFNGDVTSIGENAFAGCSSLTSVTIPDRVKSIGQTAFANCSGLTSITSLATTAPTIISSTFQNVKTGGTLIVPIGSSGYDVWMGNGNYYLGLYNWTKVEQ